MRVEWTSGAEDDLSAIRAYARRTSPSFADALVAAIAERTWQLGKFPDSGAIYWPARLLRIRFVLEGSYRILYIVAKDHVQIIGVVHTSRRLL